MNSTSRPSGSEVPHSPTPEEHYHQVIRDLDAVQIKESDAVQVVAPVVDALVAEQPVPAKEASVVEAPLAQETSAVHEAAAAEEPATSGTAPPEAAAAPGTVGRKKKSPSVKARTRRRSQVELPAAAFHSPDAAAAHQNRPRSLSRLIAEAAESAAAEEAAQAADDEALASHPGADLFWHLRWAFDQSDENKSGA